MGSDKSMKNFKLHLPENAQIVHYSNIVVISHSPEEVVLDFAQTLPGREEPHVISRIIMTPKNAKMLLKALENNMQNYEENFGHLDIPSSDKESHIH